MERLRTINDARQLATVAHDPLLTEGLDKWNVVRDAMRAYGASLKAAGVMPEGIVPIIRTLIGGRRAQDVRPESVRIRADLVTWGIEGYYAASRTSPA